MQVFADEHGQLDIQKENTGKLLSKKLNILVQQHLKTCSQQLKLIGSPSGENWVEIQVGNGDSVTCYICLSKLIV